MVGDKVSVLTVLYSNTVYCYLRKMTVLMFITLPVYRKTSNKRRVSNKRRTLAATQSCQSTSHTLVTSFLPELLVLTQTVPCFFS